jgi:hypothetical protein
MRSGSTVDAYPTVAVNCTTCGCRLFRYKKKNGTKSNLIKCYIERIIDQDRETVLASSSSLLQPPSSSQIKTTATTTSLDDTSQDHHHHHHPRKHKNKKHSRNVADQDVQPLIKSQEFTKTFPESYYCPQCQTKFARFAIIKGLPALKLVGGKVRMTKK